MNKKKYELDDLYELLGWHYWKLLGAKFDLIGCHVSYPDFYVIPMEFFVLGYQYRPVLLYDAVKGIASIKNNGDMLLCQFPFQYEDGKAAVWDNQDRVCAMFGKLQKTQEEIQRGNSFALWETRIIQAIKQKDTAEEFDNLANLILSDISLYWLNRLGLLEMINEEIQE